MNNKVRNCQFRGCHNTIFVTQTQPHKYVITFVMYPYNITKVHRAEFELSDP